jgi:acetyltransferase-like isoleucine patch superfamily enzyme
MIFDNYIPILSVVFKSSWVSKVGMQDETVPGVEDHDYWLRLCRAGASFYGMKDRLFVYRVHDNNFSSNLINQQHSSLIIRIKNFERQFLNNEETKRFERVFKKYLEYFRKEGKIEWQSDLSARFERLNLPTVPMGERISDNFSALIKGSKSVLKKILKRCVFFLLQIFYFYPKKALSNYKQRISTLYTNWLNSPNIVNPWSISHSATASINFFKEYNSKLDVQSIHIGDYSQLNFVKDNSRMTGGSDILIGKFCVFNIVGELVLGNNVLFNNHSTLTCHREIVIGDNSWFGEGVKFYDHNHRYQDRNRPFTQQGYDDGKIEIGNNVWIGSNTVILKNVSIGDGCVIGANNVVYKSLPPNTIVKSRSMELIDVIK